MAKFPKIGDFGWLIVIAIALMAIFYFMTPLSSTVTPTGVKAIKEFTLGSVGYVEAIPAKTLVLGTFKVGQTQTNVLRSLPRLTLSSSLFGADSQEYVIDVPSWYHDSMEKLVINFNVAESNMYGNLVIKWNGREVFYETANPRGYSVEITPDYVEEQNTLVVMAEGPGMRFWANTIYDLRDLEVNLKYGPVKLYPFELFPNELQSFRNGEVQFYGSGPAKLLVKVNGKQIYYKTPTGQDSADFSFTDVPLSMGENILSFETREGIVDLFNTELKIFLLTNQITRSRSFNLTSQDQLAMSQKRFRGRVTYTVESIEREGSLSIKLNGNTLSVPQPAVGENTVYFTSGDSREGKNTVEFSGTGSFEISKVLIELAAA